MPGFYIGTELGEAITTEDGFALVSEDFLESGGGEDGSETGLSVASWELAGVNMIQVVGDPGGDLIVEGTISGTTWHTCELRQMATDNMVTTITTAGLYLLDTTGLVLARMRRTSGTGTPSIHELPVIGGL